MFKNRLLVDFLKNENAKKLHDSFLEEPTVQKQEQIEKLFRVHVRKIQLLNYFSEVLHFESQHFDKKVRKNNHRQQLILDKETTDGGDKVVDLIQIDDTSEVVDLEVFAEFIDLENFFEDKLLYEIVSNLSLKQKKILHAIFVKNMSEEELAQELGVTKQAINKSKNQTFKKIKREYESRKQG